ncbi:MAG: hypothetical protein ACWA5R_11485 [bacterium]
MKNTSKQFSLSFLFVIVALISFAAVAQDKGEDSIYSVIKRESPEFYNRMMAQKEADAIREAEIEAEVKEFDKKWQGKNVHISLKNGILNVDGVWNETPKHLEIDYINGTEVLTQ